MEGTAMREVIDLMLIVALLMVVTNPDQDSHRTTLCQLLPAAETSRGVFAKIGSSILGKADAAAPLVYNNFYLFSTTTRNGATVSVGAFSHVWKVQ
jgi:hypothetical protein